MSEEAKPVCPHCERLARWTDNAQERLAQSVKEVNALRAAHEALLRRTQSLETALDQERAKVERLLAAAKVADWEQVRLNGGPPCFHIEKSEFRKGWAPDVLDYRFCLRAERWPGHPTLHKFVTLHDALLSGRGEGGA